MERRSKKRILYSVCFICLVFIDWIRGSQIGVYWETAINLTGVFVSVMMMSHFRWKKESKKPYLLWMVLWGLGSALGYGIWRVHPGKIFLSQYWTAAMSVLFVGIVAVRIWRERRQFENCRIGKSFLLACWVVMSVLMTCSRMGEIWQGWYVIVFLTFYIIPFSEEERRDLWDGMADGLIAGFFLLQIYAYGFRPYDELRYKGAFGNCNMNALFYMVTYIALLYRIHSLRWQEKKEAVPATWKRKLMKLLLWILTAGIWGFLFLTMTRTALLAAGMITVIYGIIEFRLIYGEKFGTLFIRGAALLLGAVLLFPAVYLTVRYLPTILHHPIWVDGEYSVDKVHSFDPADSEKYISLEELFEGVWKRFGNKKESKADEVINDGEYPLTGDAAKSSTRIRLEIWKLYLGNLNLTGHTLEEGYFQITRDYHAWHAQNIFVQVGFYHGIIAGALFLIIMAGLGIRSLRLVLRKRRCEDLLPLLVWTLFVAYGMLESVWYPGQMILLLIYLVPKIVIDGRYSGD